MITQEWLIKTAKKTVPPFKWVIGATALMALAGIVIKWGVNLGVLFLVAGVILVCAVAFICLQWITKLKPAKTNNMAASVAWAMLLFLLAALAFVLSSAVTDWPWKLRTLLDEKITGQHAPQPTYVPPSVPSQAPAALANSNRGNNPKIDSPDSVKPGSSVRVKRFGPSVKNESPLGGNRGDIPYTMELGEDELFTKIVVHWWTVIDGLTVETSKGNHRDFGTTTGIGEHKDQTHRDPIQISADDYITEIKVRVGDYNGYKVITGISFKIHNAKTGKDQTPSFGKDPVQALAAGESREVSGFWGKHGSVLDNIGIFTRTRTD